MWRRSRLGPLALVAVAVLASACNPSHAAQPVGDVASPPSPRSPSPSPTRSAPADPAAVHANELGLVPVLMYHQIVATPHDPYDQTPVHFRGELETLAREHYVPVTAAAYVAGRIDIPAGTHPVVLSFDDATLSQFRLGHDGRPKPGTAVAILEQVAAEHAGFTPTATFFVNSHPFTDRSGATVLRWLHAHGFDVGDHTADHANLRRVDAATGEREIAEDLAMIDKAVPGIDVTTLALPYGAYPKDRALAHRGSADGTRYAFAGVFLVGAGPAPSPFARDFDPFAVPRVRSGQPALQSASDARFVSDYYLDWLQRHPASRYTSDGNPATISFPKGLAGRLAARYRDEARPY